MDGVMEGLFDERLVGDVVLVDWGWFEVDIVY